MIKIGVPACLLPPDPTRKYFSAKTLCYIENEMASYLRKPDVLPILIPYVSGDILASYINDVDAIVLQGGDDMSPLSYGKPFLDESRWPGCKLRDEYELMVIDMALERNKPILGICRGAQVLNVYFGGTLMQDIATERPNALVHHDKAQYDTLKHEVSFVQGEFLDELYDSYPRRFINSIHHQCVDKLAETLVAAAYSVPDGIVEGFRFHDLSKHFVIGVQWHPEFNQILENEILPSDPLYDYFLARLR